MRTASAFLRPLVLLVTLLVLDPWAEAEVTILRSFSTTEAMKEPFDGFGFIDPRGFMSYNQDAPFGGNDGALWQGKGFNASLDGGVFWRNPWLLVVWAPQLSFSQNQDFETINGTNGDYGAALDRLQRFGTTSLGHYDWGDSQIRFTVANVTLGFGTESLWLGSSQRNSILLSNQGGGFPHLDIGTAQPWKTPYGSFEINMMWGALPDSQVYLGHSSSIASDWSFYHGLVLGYSPPFAPGLTLGAARTFNSPLATVNLFKTFESIDDTFWKKDRGNLNGYIGEDDVDQQVSVYVDFRVPEIGLHLYGELARNDHAYDLTDFLLQPDHSNGYVFGVDNHFPVPLGNTVELFWVYEAADTGVNAGTILRPTGSWYRHTFPSYTVNGQILGAAIGPGSNSQFAELGLRSPQGQVALTVERTAKDNDYVYNVLFPTVPGTTMYNLDVVMEYGLLVGIPWQDHVFRIGLYLENELDKNFIKNNNVNSIRATAEWQWKLGSAQWQWNKD